MMKVGRESASRTSLIPKASSPSIWSATASTVLPFPLLLLLLVPVPPPPTASMGLRTEARSRNRSRRRRWGLRLSEAGKGGGRVDSHDPALPPNRASAGLDRASLATHTGLVYRGRERGDNPNRRSKSGWDLGSLGSGSITITITIESTLLRLAAARGCASLEFRWRTRLWLCQQARTLTCVPLPSFPDSLGVGWIASALVGC
ncbi:hypothetical protein F5883DRAFT_546650 [Diaporthe sp. PMI_573]|nr:hypothetical protein F5883DRAFT_546650 [Diaporthaceae sp. PMI_573]